MEALEAINTRRSIRTYEDKPVPDELAAELLRAGAHAPSANNAMPWEFVIVRDRAILEKLSGMCRHWWMLGGAPLCIVVVGNIENYPSSNTDFFMEDCAACTQNILLAAHALGLGACWLGCYPAKERSQSVAELLGARGGNLIPFSLISVGYPAEQPGGREEAPARVHYESYR